MGEEEEVKVERKEVIHGEASLGNSRPSVEHLEQKAGHCHDLTADMEQGRRAPGDTSLSGSKDIGLEGSLDHGGTGLEEPLGNKDTALEGPLCHGDT